MTTHENQQPDNKLKIGRKLTDARRKMKLRVPSIARELHIKESYLKALESDNYLELPGRAYALGFLRTYAEYLELDADAMVREVSEAGVFETAEHLDIPSPLDQGGLPTKQVVIIALLLLILTLIAWKGYEMYAQKPVDNETVVEETIDPITENAQSIGESIEHAVDTVKEQVGSVLESVKETAAEASDKELVDETAQTVENTGEEVSTESQEVLEDIMQAVVEPSKNTAQAPKAQEQPMVIKAEKMLSEQAKEVAEEAKKAVEATRLAVSRGIAPKLNKVEDAAKSVEEDLLTEELETAETVEKTAPIVNEKPAGARIKMLAHRDVWFQIRRDGRVLINRTLQPNEAYWVRPREGQLIDVGRTSDLEIFVDGNSFGRLSNKAWNAKGVPLNADYLVSTYFAQNMQDMRNPSALLPEVEGEEVATNNARADGEEETLVNEPVKVGPQPF